MSKLIDMKQDRANLTASMREIMDRYEDTTLMSVDDKATFEKLEAEFDALNNRILDEEKQLERERAAGEIIDKSTVVDVNKPNLFAKALSGDSAAIKEYKNTFTLGDDDQAGALTAPMEFRNELIKELDDFLFMRQICRVLPPIGEGQSLGFPQRTTGAVVPSWTGEITAATEETTLAFGRREFAPKRIADLIKMSRTLMNHASTAEGILREEIGYRLALAQECAYMTGSGSGEPLGVFTASADGIPTTRDISAGNTTAAVTFDGLMNAKYAIKQQYQPNCQWIMHRDLAKMLATIKNEDGQYVWQPSVQLGQPDMLLGKPVNVSEYAPNTFSADSYVGIYGDFRYYWIVDADAMTIQVLNELYAPNNQIGYLWNFAGDGAPVVAEAFARVTLAPTPPTP